MWQHHQVGQHFLTGFRFRRRNVDDLVTFTFAQLRQILNREQQHSPLVSNG
ncbi:Uncharacterised protein [Vibrio cholerae]|nr:Uncharacterised protein [Vibrio cholerae]